MWFFIVVLLVVCAILGISLYYSVRLNLKCYEKLESIGEQIEKSLDVLDTCYQRAATRANLEVFSDDPIVRELVEDIKITKDAILLVANLIVEPMQGDNLEKDDGQNGN
jgi:hypothetical protein